MDIAGLPVSNRAQCGDPVWLWERVFRDGNRALFVAAVAAAGLALYVGTPGWAWFAAVVAATTLGLGKRFAVKLPHTHLSEMRVPLLHGEVVPLVDLPRHQVREIEDLLGQHLEAHIGGVGWTVVWAGP